MRRKKSPIVRIILTASFILIGISILKLAGPVSQDIKDWKSDRKVKEMYQDASEDTDTENPVEIDAGLLAMHKENPDCVAWIRIEDTTIDYPVMYRPDSSGYYLHRDFYGNYSAAGCLYLAENCDPDRSMNRIIYGHHMRRDAMFHSLMKYQDKEFWEEHQMIEYRTLHGNETYRIIAAFHTPVYTGHDFAYYAFTDPVDQKEYQDFIETVKKKAYYVTGLTAEYGDRLLTLSTCEYSLRNGRMVVVAKQVWN